MSLRKSLEGQTIPYNGPASHLVAITPSNATDLSAEKIKALWVGGAGDVAVIGVSDAGAITLSAVPAGTLLPVMVTKVMATGTTATLIVGLG